MKRLSIILVSLLLGCQLAYAGDLEMDNMEYATNGAAQAAYVSDSPSTFQSYSEGTIKTQGSYSLKAIASASALGSTMQKALSPVSDLTGVKNLKFDMRASRTGENIKLGLVGSGSYSTAGGTVPDAVALDFTGNNYVTLTSRVTFGTTATINVWVKDYTTYSVLGGCFDNGVTRYMYWYSDGGIYQGSTTFPEQVTWTAGDFSGWHMITLTFNSTTLEYYKDGVAQGTKTLSDLPPLDYIGMSWGLGTTEGFEAYLNATMDSMNIWSRTLSAQEVGELFNGGRGMHADNFVSPFNSGLVHSWDFNEGTGTTITDSIGGNTGTATGGAWVAGKVKPNEGLEQTKPALTFGGTYGDWVSGSVTNIPLGNATYSLTAWFKATSYTQDHSTIASWGQAIAGNVITLLDIRTDGTLYTETGSGANAINSLASVLDGVWHLGTLTYDGNYLKMYVDGVLQGTSSGTTLEVLTSDLHIGDMVWATGYPFLGDISQVAIWNRALSESEINILYNGGKGVYGTATAPVFASGLIGGWNLSEGTGTSISDFSGNGNTLTISNGNSSISWAGGLLKTVVPSTWVDGDYTYRVFYTDGTLTTGTTLDAEVELLAGGGGGACGGGGAGGVLYDNSFAITAGTHTITIGQGGAGSAITTGGGEYNASDGGDTTLSTLTANGGGGGANTGNTGVIYGNDGGSSGAGGAYSNSETFGGTATPSGQGHIGGGNGAFVGGNYPSGGGGGYGEAGHNGTGDELNNPPTTSGAGGDGAESSILSGVFFGGGGGGASYYDGVEGYGGAYGGGNGGRTAGDIFAQNGLAYHGGGGGGAPSAYESTPTVAGVGGSGGSGVAIIKYLTPTQVIIDEYTPNIHAVDTWEPQNYSVAHLTDEEKGAITGLIFTVENADEANTLFVDNMEIAQAIDVFGQVD